MYEYKIQQRCSDINLFRLEKKGKHGDHNRDTKNYNSNFNLI